MYKQLKTGIPGYLFVLVPTIFLLVFNVIPMAVSLVVSLTEWNGITAPKFVGLENYAEVLSPDSRFYSVLANTLIFAVLYVVGIVVVGLIVALSINRIRRGKSFFRVAYFVPYISPLVVASMVWILLYADDGLINSILNRLGLGSVGWLSDPDVALLSIILMSIWQSMGFAMVIFVGGLSNISEQLYEAATIDGAGVVQSFRHVTVPGLRPTFAFVIIYGLILGFQVFDQIFVMTGGGPVGATESVVFSIYDHFRDLDLGTTSAIAYVLFLILLAVSVVQLRLFRED